MSLKDTFRKYSDWEYDRKTTFFAIVSLCLTVAFAVMNAVIAIRDRTLWHGAVAIYYVLLIAFRAATIVAVRIGKRRFRDDGAAYANWQNKIYLGCGAFLALIEIATCVAVTEMVLHGKPVRNGQIFAIANAAYTFYKITMAIVNLVKAKKYSDPAMQALRNLNFADACTSMVSLTVLMLSTFSEEENGTFFIAMKACVGFAACAAILAVATVMIIRGAKNLQNPRTDGQNRRDGE